jgi:hypothetical protein
MKRGFMSVFRWLLPVVFLACLGGFVLGYLLPQWIQTPSVQACLQCGGAAGVLKDHKIQKLRSSNSSGTPLMLSDVTVVRRGEPVDLVVQTTPGAICAISVFYNGGHDTYNLPVTFADQDGRCGTSMKLPQNVTVGNGRLLVCASACLDQKFFEIQ